jgi:hypothetical protein
MRRLMIALNVLSLMVMSTPAQAKNDKLMLPPPSPRTVMIGEAISAYTNCWTKKVGSAKL